MNYNHAMPGSFPGSIPYESTSSQFQPKPLQYKNTNERLASSILQTEEMSRFLNTTYINMKTKAQHHLIGQLGLLVYVFAFYQFIKFCHSACLIPLVLHYLYQIILSFEVLTNISELPWIKDLVSDTLEPDEQQNELNSKITYVCRMIYGKCLFVIVYHIVFICTWMVSVVNRGELHELVNGTWWVVSFIGENIPDISPSTPYYEKVLRLGLLQLLFTDLVIIVIELILFQCIYKQSPLLKVGRTLNEREIYCVRQATVPGITISDNDVSTEDVPTVLKVRLFECFKREGYLNL